MANSLTVGTLQLTANFNTISVEAFYADDDNADGICNIEYKRSAVATWTRLGSSAPLAGDDATRFIPGAFRYTETAGTAGTQRAFYGKIHYLVAGVSYDVRVTFTDPDGVTGRATRCRGHAFR
jgi:hypothetical protein